MDLARQQISNSKISKIFAWFLVLTLTALCVNYIDLIFSKVRDTKRKADLKQLQTALAVYQNKFNEFPKNKSSLETINSLSGEFLNDLLQKNIIAQLIKDPLNTLEYYYHYQKYPAGAFGCEKSFYILQIKNFELATQEHGTGSCPEKDFTKDAANGYTLQVFE